MNSKEFLELAHTHRHELIKLLITLVSEKRISTDESAQITHLVEEVVYAERMNVHKVLDEAREKVSRTC